jgi:4-amino-4-deoxy-L-arabinose transferase-like glycosyltransferase
MSAASQTLPAPRPAVARLPVWWPLAALTLLAAVLRLSTLGLQGFWFDEAYTPLHVLHPSLFTTLEWVPKTENTPPLWYLIEWFDYRLLGSGEYALRLPSAIAGIALVPVAWRIGLELADRAAAIACAALVAVGPLFVWYSQEARAYGLFMFTSGLALLAFVRVLREPSGRRLALFWLAGSLMLLSHYFGAFVLAGMAAWLLADPRTRRPSLPALLGLAAVALALVPLVLAQGGRSTQWIGEWPLKERIADIGGYYVSGYSGGHLGHTIQLLVALPLIAVTLLGAWRMRQSRSPETGAGPNPPVPEADLERRREAVWVTLAVSAAGVLLPLVMALGGADYLAPRNLVGAMVPATALLAVLATWPAKRGALGPALLAVALTALLAMTVTIDFDPQVQRGDWKAVVHALPRERQRVTVVNLLGSGPFRYYTPGLLDVPRHGSVRAREIVMAGEGTVGARASRPPVPGFRLVQRIDIHRLVAFRFVAREAHVVSALTLRRRAISAEQPTVLAPASVRTAR